MSHEHVTYQHIERDLIEGIESGKYPVGTMIPSIRDLAARYMVSRGTVEKALRELRYRGMIEQAPGRGNVVRSSGQDRP